MWLSLRTVLLVLALVLVVGLAPVSSMIKPVAAFSRYSSIVLQPEEDDLRSAVIDPGGQYAYFATDTSPGRIVKVRLSDFTRVAAIGLQTGEAFPTSAVIDPSGQYAYFGT